MRKNIIKISKTLVLISVFTSIFISVNFCYAAENLNNAFKTGGPLDVVAGNTGYDTDKVEVEGIISQIITTALTFVGVVFLGLAIYAGYNWMIARGEEEKVTKAKDTLTAAVIGLVIVIAAYAISYYVISALGGAALKQTSDQST